MSWGPTASASRPAPITWGWCRGIWGGDSAGALEWKELEEFLLARAMEHDSPSLMFRLACEHLISAQVIRPGPVALIERVATARAAAERQTYQRVAHLLTGHRGR